MSGLKCSVSDLEVLFAYYTTRPWMVIEATVEPEVSADLATLFAIGVWNGTDLLRVGQTEMQFKDILEPLRRANESQLYMAPLIVHARTLMSTQRKPRCLKDWRS